MLIRHRCFIRILVLSVFALPLQLVEPIGAATSAEDRDKAWQQHLKLRNESPHKQLKWRSVGPRKQGGRIESIAVHPQTTSTMYVGVGSGNLWKTINNGTTWTPIFENESSFTIGDVAISKSNPDTIWVGTGEELMARSSFAGTGVFRSKDAGKTWTNRGLEDSHHIGRVLIHPKKPNTVYVAVIGRLYSDNTQRGVFKTTNGGETWKRILYVDEKTGAIDLEMDPSNPKRLYATTWQHERKAWNHISHGPGSRIYRTENAGRKWEHLTEGLPTGDDVGRIAIHIAPSAPKTLYALVNLKEQDDALFRSDDGGDSWRQVNEEKVKSDYGFCMVRVSPTDPEELYLPGQRTYVSRDGGKTFKQIGGTLVHLLDHDSKILHLDAHAFWINPSNPNHIVAGNDGGLHISYDRCESWLHLNNLPIGEFYAIHADNDTPYNIYGGTQDNAALFGPSDHSPEDDVKDPWKQVYIDRWGGGDSYFTYRDPSDKNIFYYEHQFGVLRRKEMDTGRTKTIRPNRNNILQFDSNEPDLRSNWMTPYFISQYNPWTLYYGANKLFKSVNRGDKWIGISPDLSTQPGPEKQGNVPYGTITTLSESKFGPGFIYAGTDDGNVHVTRDDGTSWKKINDGLPDKWVSRVIASRHDRATAYVTLTGYREDDFTPYVYRSKDYGKTWTSISANLPAEPVNVIREDPRKPGVIYLGTDLGAYVSTDDGQRWESIGNGLPSAAVHDLFVHEREKELVAGTHGRSIYVIDIESVVKE